MLGTMVHPTRVRLLNDVPGRGQAEYVLYWAQINRRLDSNHALAFAVDIANKLGLPVLVYEGLTCSHPHANDRLQTFVMEGVADNAKRAAELGLGYVFYHRARKTDANDTLYRLAKKAAVVVTDDYPGYLAERHNASVPAKIGIPYYVVDSSCVVPMSCMTKQEYAAYTIRPKIQRLLEEHLHAVGPIRVRRKWAEAASESQQVPVAESDVDHSVAASTTLRGGRKAALAHLQLFLKKNLVRYARHKNEPSEHATSRMSAYLHFGYISATEIALAVRGYAAEHKLIAVEYLEELIVRRELAFNFARFGPRPETLEALPEWARNTLAKHDVDRRDPVYDYEQFERAATYDDLWNATQTQLLREGVIHGYYRMYWGKKIIEWSRTHQAALDTMIRLHDKYALDGRDPNTYGNILWCFGLHDRPWTERPILGMIRYMNLAGMKRKTDVRAYVEAMR
ncbi:MAG: deoxyribodipyrimidine photo-lyase [Acidobacteriota bacterium]